MEQTDATRKYRIVLIVGALALIGFFLEVGPLGGVFSLANSGPPVSSALALELAAFGFLAYLALAASAAVGLHLGEEEPKPKPKEKDEERPAPPEPIIGTVEMPPEPEGAAEGVRVRPDLHQMRMFFTALAGYSLLKGISISLMLGAAAQYGIGLAALLRAFSFGLAFIAIGWFLLWQFLRWYATEKKWMRLQEELVGGDVFRAVAVVLLLKPAFFLYGLLTGAVPASGLLLLLTGLLYLTPIAAAWLLWVATQDTFRTTLRGLAITGVIAVTLTVILATVEQAVT
ncbi:MAG: hypothetical protein BWY76_02387 [bacterium ADurb.Bin429]|nr:MAG: hypothetical protein BWY76_02387 [bacterium ADurb.Bin429]